MGLCFFLETYRGLRLVGHTGSQKAFFSFFYIDPVARTGAIAAFNSNGVSDGGEARPDARRILNHLREGMFGRIFPLFR